VHRIVSLLINVSAKMGCGKAASFSGAIIWQCLEGLQSQPRKGETVVVPIPESPVRANFFQPEGKLMKNFLFATSALVASAGIASADFSMSATAKLTYGNYGTGHSRAGDATVNATPSTAAAPARKWLSEADVDVTMTGGGDTVSYSATLEIAENGLDAGALSISTGGITVKYDANAIGGITKTGFDGTDSDLGDIMVSYAGNGITASYEEDLDGTAGYEIIAGYAADGVSLGLKTNGTVSELSAGYTLGDLAVAVSANNETVRKWDASVAYTIADATVTVATDEASVATAAVSTTLNGLALTAKTGGDNELSIGYAAGDLGFLLSYDTGNKGHFGDEAQTTVVIDYAIDGLGFQLKANDQSEMEISSSLSF
jgi:outer membrane protein OmpU